MSEGARAGILNNISWIESHDMPTVEQLEDKKHAQGQKKKTKKNTIAQMYVSNILCILKLMKG